ncbi:alpha-mannosidase 2C1-like [Styela clava]
MANKRIASSSRDNWGEKLARKSMEISNGNSPFHHVTLKHRRTTLGRVDKFLSPIYFTDVNIFGRLYQRHAPVMLIKHFGPTNSTFQEISKCENHFKNFIVGDNFGPTFSRHWFKLSIEIPSSWIREKVQLIWDMGCEGLIWRNNKPVFSLNYEDEFGVKKRYNIYEKFQQHNDRSVTLYISVSCNRLLGEGKNGMINPTDLKKMFTLTKAEIVTLNSDAYNTFLDLCLLHELAKSLPEDSQRSTEALYSANEIINILVKSKFSEQGYTNARDISKKFFTTKTRDGEHIVHAMGHCHIDSAWLWPYSETIHKCARSWISTLTLMDKFPDFTFVCSQAQQFEWVKENYPEIYKKLKIYVKEGRFIPVGGTWIEMDGNIPSGESMIRQFVFGQRFFLEEFGITCKEFWLPDTFGYSANLPQIMNEAGIHNFLTQKLSWNLVNTFPHNTFHWEGIDGSRVICHFPPGDSYGMHVKPEELLKTMSNHKDKGRSDTSVFLFGFGDGGGGPTEGMLHRLSRMSNCAGLPKVKMSTPDQFFADVVKTQDKLCTWVGELFLELHNGTYTTQAKIKKFNRKCEILLHNIEFMWTLAESQKKKDFPPYPRQEIDRLWKLLLLNQFHDVLPGSSIELVNQDACKYYEDIMKSGEILINTANKSLIKHTKNKTEFSFLNSLSWDRKEVVELPDKSLSFIFCPSLSMTSIHICETDPVIVEPQKNGMISLRNSKLRCTFDNGGRLVSLQLNNAEGSKELIKSSHFGNQLVLFDDVPLFWDAWDVMDYHLETRSPVLDVIEPLHVSEKSCELRGILEFSVRIGDNSKLKQTIELDADSPVIRFKTFVDWQENHKFLKVEFPWNIHSTKATHEVQFGHLERPNHQNTSWDSARFEVWAHKWADLSEYNCGVAILNDCKYGYSTFGSTMRLSLLRSPKAPDDNADMGEHEFTYEVMPHSKSLQESGVIKQAFQLNNPLRAFEGKVENDLKLANLNTDAVILDTCKKSDVHKDAMLLRLYEAFGSSTECEITLSNSCIKKVERCNILEEPKESCDIEINENHSFTSSFSPFQIQSFLVWLD